MSQALSYETPFHYSNGGSFVHAPPPVAPPAPVIIIPIFQPQQQPTGGGASPPSAGDTTPSPERPSSTRKMRKTTPGRVLGEADEEDTLFSSPPDEEEPAATRRKIQCKKEDQDKKEEAAVGLKDVTASRTRARPLPQIWTLAMSYLRPGQGFSPSQATLDPATSVNWVSGDLVRDFFPAGQFTRIGSREYYESPGEIGGEGRCRFESDESIVITWRCASGKTFFSEFRVLRCRNSSSIGRRQRARASPLGFVFGRAAMKKHRGEFDLGMEEAKRRLMGRHVENTNEKPSTTRTFAASASVHRVSKSGTQGRQQRRQEGVGVHPGRLASWSESRRQVQTGL